MGIISASKKILACFQNLCKIKEFYLALVWMNIFGRFIMIVSEKLKAEIENFLNGFS